MASWRDSASAQAQADLDGLLEPALEVAQRHLARRGEFFPYAVAVAADGQTEMVRGVPDGLTDQPASSDVIDACRVALTDRRDELRAAAVVADIRLPDGTDAVRVELEHVEGLAITVVMPYSKRRLRRGMAYGELRAGTGTQHVWPAV